MKKSLILLICVLVVPVVGANERLKFPKETEAIAAIEDAIATKSYASIYKDSKQMFAALEQSKYIGDNSNLDKIRELYPWRYSGNYFFQTWIVVTSKAKGLRLRVFKSMKGDAKKLYCCVSELGSHKESYYQLPSEM